MVGEFPELQGVMGSYYARHDGEPQAVAAAIDEHYQPRFAGDALPRRRPDSSSRWPTSSRPWPGLFGIGQLPTGDKDPFALRRHALGVIRMLIEKRPGPGVRRARSRSRSTAFGASVSRRARRLASFIHERLSGYLRETRLQPRRKSTRW